MPRAVVIANPHAGRGRFGTSPEVVVRRLETEGYTTTVRPTTGPGVATRWSAEAAAAGCDLVVAYGGDGTVHEVAAGLVGTPVPMAVLPGGSGNDFAVGLGCVDVATGLDAAVSGRVRRLDAWAVDGRPFFNSLGLLASGLVSGRAARLWRFLAGLRYRLAALATLATYGGQLVRWLPDDGDRLEGEWLLAEVCNGPLTGGGFRFAPEAEWDDGRLDLCLIRPVSLWTALRLLPGAAAGRPLDHPAVTVTAAAGLEFESAEPVACHRDGEPGVLAAGRHRIEAMPGGLLVKTPAERTP